MTFEYIISSIIFIVLGSILLCKILKCKKIREILIYFNLLCLIISLCFTMYGNYQNNILYIYIGLFIIVIKTIIFFLLFKYMKLGD